MFDLKTDTARPESGRATDLLGKETIGEFCRKLAAEHPCSKHPLFQYLDSTKLTREQARGFLANYDAHASVLRRLLLKSATIMPEEAVGFILENVRNEYGNGNPDHRHQLQLHDLANKAGIATEELQSAYIEDGVKQYIAEVPKFYFPEQETASSATTALITPAISAGAITATEILAVEEFRHMQKCFAHFKLDQHIWFDHVMVEVEHSEESVALAVFFAGSQEGIDSVLYGLEGVLNANVTLYDGLLAAASR